MQVEIVTSANSACDDFVRSRPDGKLCHLRDWGQMIQRAFGHEPFYLAAVENGVVQGVLPLTLVRSRLFGVHLVSQAFSNYGGPLIADEGALAPLLDRAYRVAEDCRCHQIEFRSMFPLSSEHHCRSDKICMHLPLNPDPEVVWGDLRSEIRNRVRKAEKAGLTTLDGGVELLSAFYDVWTVRMRQLGTPCYSRRFFFNLIEQFPQHARIFLVRHGDTNVGVGLFYTFNGLAQCRWAATLTAYNPISPNMLLYWSAIKYYSLAGTTTFDFGRSTQGSSQHEFKRRWGAETIQLYYEHWTQAGYPLEMTTPDSPRYRRKVEMWKRLPLSMTRVLGPWISCGLP
jgi:FemAB-related protein (PEP-CTERM system-associated)